MGRASYQNIDNIVIGDKKAVSLSLVKKNHKKVKVCVSVVAERRPAATFSPSSSTYSTPTRNPIAPQGAASKPVREVLRLKFGA